MGTATKVPRPAAQAAALAEFARLFRSLVDPYRPELHYMRGPGPKWHAKHGTRPAEAPACRPRPHRGLIRPTSKFASPTGGGPIAAPAGFAFVRAVFAHRPTSPSRLPAACRRHRNPPATA